METISQKEVDAIQSVYIDLTRLMSQMEGVVHPSIVKSLNDMSTKLQEVCAPWMQKEEALEEEKMQRYEQMRKTLGALSIWSANEVINFNAPIPFEGANKVVYKNHWGSAPVEVALPYSATWEQLYLAADACIKQSGDAHHIFIESFKQQGDTLELHTGS